MQIPTQAGGDGEAGSITLDELQAMTPSEFLAWYKANNPDMPLFMLSYSEAQKTIYSAGVNDKPQVVDKATFDAMSGTTIYRTVNQSYDSSSDVGMRADQIVSQTLDSSLFRVGTGIHGDGLYFTTDRRHSERTYGSYSGDVRKTAVMQAKLNSNARVVDKSRLISRMRTDGFLNNGVDMTSAALYYGYNVITEMGVKISGGRYSTRGTNYTNVIDRSVLTFYNTAEPKS